MAVDPEALYLDGRELAALPALEKLDLRWNRFARLPAVCDRLSAHGCVVLA